MKRNYNHRRVRSQHLYTINELTKHLGVDVTTVRRWRGKGLKVIDADSRPLLIEGKEVIRFIKQMKQKRSVKLSREEFYCFRCRKAVKSHNGIVTILFDKSTPPSLNRKARIIGRCHICDSIINKYSTQSELSLLIDEQRLILTEGQRLKWRVDYVFNARLGGYTNE